MVVKVEFEDRKEERISQVSTVVSDTPFFSRGAIVYLDLLSIAMVEIRQLCLYLQQLVLSG